MSGFAIGNGTHQSVEAFRGVVDTGGPDISLPPEINQAYFATLGGAYNPNSGFYEYPCTANPPPDLTVDFQDGGSMTLNGTFLVYPAIYGDTCYGRLGDQDGLANIGQSAIDQKFVVFDFGGKRIGWADKSASL